jgi:hypothetical protein
LVVGQEDKTRRKKIAAKFKISALILSEKQRITKSASSLVLGFGVLRTRARQAIAWIARAASAGSKVSLAF